MQMKKTQERISLQMPDFDDAITAEPHCSKVVWIRINLHYNRVFAITVVGDGMA